MTAAQRLTLRRLRNTYRELWVRLGDAVRLTVLTEGRQVTLAIAADGTYREVVWR